MKQIVFASFLCSILLCGCMDLGKTFKNLGKSDIDLVSDINIEELTEHIKTISIRLYEKNPAELSKNPRFTLENRLTQILEHPIDIAYKELSYKQSTEAIDLSLDKSYRNDRVFALMLGISSMIRFSYNGRAELYILDQLDPQKLYDSARNLEKILQRFKTESETSSPLLNIGADSGVDSFEDLMTRMISIQDVMAKVVADKNDRIINQVIQGTASILIPIPL